MKRTIDLGLALAVFIAEHEYYGELASVVEEERVTMTCTCGARIVRAVEGPGE